jgi:hypothetical protein
MTHSEPHVSGTPPLAAESSAVQLHLGILQDIVTRMANNSASCKTWCITLVSAMLVVLAEKAEARYAWIALLPVILFGLLDAYYLGQERAFRASYNQFVESLHSGEATAKNNLYRISPPRGTSVTTLVLQAMTSFAIYPFYLTLLGMVALTRFVIL